MNCWNFWEWAVNRYRKWVEKTGSHHFQFFPSAIILDNQKSNYKIIEILIWFGSIFQSFFLEKNLWPPPPGGVHLKTTHNFYPKILPKIFTSNFYSKYLPKIFTQNFTQNFHSEFSLKILTQNFYQKFYPKFLPKIFAKNFYPKFLPVRSILSASTFCNESSFPSLCSTDNTSQSLCQIFWPCHLSIFRLEINCDISVQNPVSIVILKKSVIMSNFWKLVKWPLS